MSCVARDHCGTARDINRLKKERNKALEESQPEQINEQMEQCP